MSRIPIGSIVRVMFPVGLLAIGWHESSMRAICEHDAEALRVQVAELQAELATEIEVHELSKEELSTLYKMSVDDEVAYDSLFDTVCDAYPAHSVWVMLEECYESVGKCRRDQELECDMTFRCEECKDETP